MAGYSKGMRQRIKLAQAIAHEPSVLVLDEPLNGLDPMARAEVIALFRELADAGCHVVVSSHILHEVDLISDQVVLLNGGYVVAEGAISGVRDEMEEEHPVQVLIRCDRPSLLASRVFAEDRVGRGADRRGRPGPPGAHQDADRFYLLLNRIVLEDGLAVEAVDPGGRRRALGLPVPDRRRGKIMSSTTDRGGPAGRPRTAAPTPGSSGGASSPAVVRLELRKSFLGRRGLWLYLLAAAPVALFTLLNVLPTEWVKREMGGATWSIAGVYQGFILRIVLFLAAVAVFGGLIRREILDRSLHFYFLAPMRRELLVVGKYLTGVAVTFVAFRRLDRRLVPAGLRPRGGGTVSRFLFHGPGLAHLGAYLLVTALACVGYGAVFLAFGCFVKSPAMPALAVFGWESIHFLLPPFLKQRQRGPLPAVALPGADPRRAARGARRRAVGVGVGAGAAPALGGPGGAVGLADAADGGALHRRLAPDSPSPPSAGGGDGLVGPVARRAGTARRARASGVPGSGRQS